MAGFVDVIAQALPYLGVEHIDATANTTWEWFYKVTDDAGTLVDMTAGYTGTCSVHPRGGGAAVVSATVTFPSVGVVRCFVAPATNASVAAGDYEHELTITRTSDGAKVVGVGAGDSTFKVKRKVS